MILDLIFKFFSKIFLFTGKLGSPNSFEKKLKPEEEREYFNRLKVAKSQCKTDPEAEEKLIKHNLRLVAHIANKYKSNFSDSDDLISVGTIGLIKAVRTYDIDKASSFSTYASRCIENEILMLFRSEKKLNSEVSLDSTIGVDKDGNDMSLSDIIADDRENLEQKTSRKIALEKIENSARLNLDKRELFVISHRYGLFKKTPKTQKEIADRLGISRSYISRIEKIALKKIKDNL